MEGLLEAYGASWKPLGSSWRPLGGSWGRLGGMLGTLSPQKALRSPEEGPKKAPNEKERPREAPNKLKTTTNAKTLESKKMMTPMKIKARMMPNQFKY